MPNEENRTAEGSEGYVMMNGISLWGESFKDCDLIMEGRKKDILLQMSFFGDHPLLSTYFLKPFFFLFLLNL